MPRVTAFLGDIRRCLETWVAVTTVETLLVQETERQTCCQMPRAAQDRRQPGAPPSLHGPPTWGEGQAHRRPHRHLVARTKLVPAS